MIRFTRRKSVHSKALQITTKVYDQDYLKIFPLHFTSLVIFTLLKIALFYLKAESFIVKTTMAYSCKISKGKKT